MLFLHHLVEIFYRNLLFVEFYSCFQSCSQLTVDRAIYKCICSVTLLEDTDVKDETAFRAKIAEGLKAQLVNDSDYKFILDVREHCEKKVGELQFPDALLKRIMLANNKDKGEEFVEKNYAESIKELTWHLIINCRIKENINNNKITNIKMKISFENPDKINGLLTLVVEEEDYKNDVEKTLKDYRKKANVPGFRPGQAPMGMIKRQFGPSVKMEAINKLVGQQIYKYVQDNNIQMLGEPLPSEKQEPADLENGTSFTFMFDIAVAPEFKVTLNGRDKVDYYNITVDDKILDQQIDMYAPPRCKGSYTEPVP
jgi:hypothetical protein